MEGLYMPYDGSQNAAFTSGYFEKFETFGDDFGISAHEALSAFHKVAPHLQIDKEAILLLNCLCTLSEPSDWTRKSRPLVIASFSEFIAITKRNEAELSRSLSCLVKNQLITVVRNEHDQNGEIIESCTIDLSLLQNRTAEFEWLDEALYYEESLKKEPLPEAYPLMSTLYAVLTRFSNLKPNLAFSFLKARLMQFLSPKTPIPTLFKNPNEDVAEIPSASYEGFLGGWPSKPLYDSEPNTLLEDSDQPDFDAAYAVLTRLIEIDQTDLNTAHYRPDTQRECPTVASQPECDTISIFCPIEKSWIIEPREIQAFFPKKPTRRPIQRYGFRNLSGLTLLKNRSIKPLGGYFAKQQMRAVKAPYHWDDLF
jgi:hypothetical protein